MVWLSRLAKRFGLARGLALALLVALAALRIANPQPIEELRVRVFDQYQVLRPREAKQRPVVIVDIDEKSLKEIGQWPWPRTRIADLVARLTQMGALAIGFDVVFPEPDRMSPALAAETFRNLDPATIDKLRALPSNDAVFADAIKHSRVVLGESGLPFTVPEPPGTPVPVGVASLGADPRPFLFNFPGLLRNVPELERAASGRGLFTIRTERDGIVRRVPMVMRAQGIVMPSLTLEMLRVVSGASTLLMRADRAGLQSVAVPGFVVPTDRNGQLWIHFAPHDQARYVPAADVLDGKIPADRVRQRLVLIGTSAVGLLDAKTTPIDPVMPGVEVHAQVLENILTGSVLAAPNYAIGVELLAALLVGLIIVWLAPILNPHWLLGFGIIIVAASVGASWYLFVQDGLLFDFTYPLLSSLLVYLTLMFANYMSEQAQRRRIRSAFSQYLSPALVEQLAQSPEKLVLGGEEREMTILFSDVRGFTTISESFKHDPQGLTHLMNSFLTPLTNAIIERKGTIDKYMGDAIMAFWNAPLHDPMHEINACEAALDMQQRVADLNRRRAEEAKAKGTRYIELNVGVGLNTGTCVVGNMGSDLRFDYSVLGDSVNLASRLEGQTKNYGVPIIIGARTAQAVRDKFALIEVDYITVKGKTEPEVIYTLLGRKDLAASSQFEKLYDLSAKMLERYRNREWDSVMAIIEASRGAADYFGLDGLLELYCERVRAFRLNPPPDDWNGVYALQTK
ncbi:MAG TPA: adenylate/guanylate cyclase domain-containing protein [Pseudolabrys sp.]|nr:adenylate/guanylate cyclase domain-containing protein [Pseudolabrys sp.]